MAEPWIRSVPWTVSWPRPLAGFRSLWWLYHSDAVLSQPERIDLEEARKIALQGFNTLSANAKELGEWKYKMRPKFHKLGTR